MVFRRLHFLVALFALSALTAPSSVATADALTDALARGKEVERTTNKSFLLPSTKPSSSSPSTIKGSGGSNERALRELDRSINQRVLRENRIR